MPPDSLGDTWISFHSLSSLKRGEAGSLDKAKLGERREKKRVKQEKKEKKRGRCM